MLASHVHSNPRQMNFSTCLPRSPFNWLLFFTVKIKLSRLLLTVHLSICFLAAPDVSPQLSVTPSAPWPRLAGDSSQISPLRSPLSPSLAALQLQGSADRENVINPIQIKRGYDKWWALALSSVISTIIISLNNFFVDFERPWPGLSLPILMVTITFEGLI